MEIPWSKPYHKSLQLCLDIRIATTIKETHVMQEHGNIHAK